MKIKNNPKQRLARRKEFTAWRKKEGLSYQAIVEKGNAKAIEAGLCLADDPALKYPAVAAWGTRGTVPGDKAAKIISLLWPSCPIIRGVIIPA